MKPPVLTVDDARDPAAEQVIAEGLRCYNQEQCGISDGRTVAGGPSVGSSDLHHPKPSRLAVSEWSCYRAGRQVHPETTYALSA